MTRRTARSAPPVLAYGAFWASVIGARLLFTYGANHWYTTQLGHWISPTGSRSTRSPTP